MAQQDDRPVEPVIVIRRRSSVEEEGHHGGVWKIAYADFMTAMMAFFLVMWLINAANTETKASVASYFNPIKLTDAVARRKGLLDVDEKQKSHDKDKERLKAKNAEKTIGPPSEQERAAATATASRPSNGVEAGISEIDARMLAGNATQPRATGPFDPLSDAITWAHRTRAPVEARDEKVLVVSAAATVQNDPLPVEQESQEQVAVNRNSDTRQSGSPSEAGDADASRHRLEDTADVIRRGVSAAVQKLGLTGGPGIDVTIEDDRIVLSLTDTSTFGMFAVGSPEPNTELVALLQHVAPVLTLHAEMLAIRGHTDGRPYWSDRRNNNWRLATARAEAAYGLLVRFGIDDHRFERIEGFADRRLKIPHDAEAAANRRIEIVIRAGGR